MLKRLFKMFFVVIFFSISGCAAGFSMLQAKHDDFYHAGRYEELIKYYENSVPGERGFLSAEGLFTEREKKKIIIENIYKIKTNQLTTADLLTLIFSYPRYVHSYIEIGQLEKGNSICDEGIKNAEMFSELFKRYQHGNRHGFIIETLRKLYLYKGYILWFTTGDAKEANKYFEHSSLYITSDKEKIYDLLDKGFFNDKILGDYKKSLSIFNEVLNQTEKLGLLDIDSKYAYSLQSYKRILHINMKLGQLEEAKKIVERYKSLTSNPEFKVGKRLLSSTEYFRGYLSIMDSTAGAVNALLRDFKVSKEYFEQSFNAIRNINSQSILMWDRKALGTYYVLYGTYYLGLQNRYKDAIDYVDKGLNYLTPYYIEAITDEIDIETAYLYSAELHFIIENYDNALNRASKAIEYAGRYHNKITAASTYTLIGQVYYRKGEKQKAKDAYETALGLVKDIESTENWKLFYGLGQVYEDTGEINQALKYYKKAVEEVEKLWQGRFKDTQKQVSFIDNRLVVFEPVIRILAKQGKAEEAVHYMERSKSRTFFETSVYYQEKTEESKLNSGEMKKLDEIKTKISSVSEKIESLSDKIQDINKKLDDDVKLASKRGVEIKKGKTKTSENLAALSPIEKKKLEMEKAQYEKSLKEYENRFDDLNERENKLLKKSNINLKGFLNIEPLKASRIKKIIPKDTAILEYYVGERSVIGIVITQKSLNIRELPISSKQLKKDVMTFRDAIENIDYQYLDDGITLYETLIQPFEKALVGYEKIVIVPHGVLHYLPFQALVLNKNSRGVSPELIEQESILVAKLYSKSRGIIVKHGQSANKVAKNEKIDVKEISDQLDVIRSQINNERKMKGLNESRPLFLVDKYQIIYSPSATILDYTQKINNKKKEKLLGLGSPPAVDVKDLNLGTDSLEKLPSAKYEVQEIGSLFGNKNIYTDEAATETVVKNNASLNDILLFSTHGILNRKDPLKSSIFFNKDKINDGRLTITEIENLNNNANIVALSACETGLVSGYE